MFSSAHCKQVSMEANFLQQKVWQFKQDDSNQKNLLKIFYKTLRQPDPSPLVRASQVKVNKSKLLEQSCLHSQRGRKVANQHVLELERSLKYVGQSERHC